MKRLVALASALVLLAGCGGDDETTPSAPATEATAPEGSTSPAEPDPGPAADVYFTTGEQFRRVERDLPDGPPERRAAAAAEELVAGPTKRESQGAVGTSTQIPAGTRVEDVELDAGGTAVVEVSEEFERDLPRGADAAAAELDARLAQVTFTLTDIPGVRRAKVVAGGEPVEAALARSDLARPEGGPPSSGRDRGRKSAGVRRLQRRLARLRYLPRSAVDGVDGYRTEQAVIAFQSWEGLARDGIVGPMTRAALAEAKPPRPRAGGPPRRIEVFREKGVTLLVRDDRTVRAIHVSTGGPGNETPAGKFEVFRKELNSWSVPFQTWLPYASYFNDGIAFHEYPDVPVYPASHGCVRVPAPDAKGVYRFAKLGTRVVVR